MTRAAWPLTVVALTLAACSGGSRDTVSEGHLAAPAERRSLAALAPDASSTPILLVYTPVPAAGIDAVTAIETALESAGRLGEAPVRAGDASAPRGDANAEAAAQPRGATTVARTDAARGRAANEPAPATRRSPVPRAAGARPSATPRSTRAPRLTATPRPTRTPRVTATPRPPTTTPEPTPDRSVLAALRGGGYVIYMRHGVTDWGQNDREIAWVEELLATRNPDLFDQCDRQRLLNDEGRAASRAIGDAIRQQGIPVGRVLTSPWCRVRETADIAFGGGDVVADKLWDTGYLDKGDERNRYRDALRGLLSESPGGGTNTVLVGHMPQLADAAGVSLSEGESVIVRPEGGGFRLLNRIAAGAWSRLAEIDMR